MNSLNFFQWGLHLSSSFGEFSLIGASSMIEPNYFVSFRMSSNSSVEMILRLTFVFFVKFCIYLLICLSLGSGDFKSITRQLLFSGGTIC